jgi:murein DD-endopeptidase MepM/ murein hydrolase activator NlpD
MVSNRSTVANVTKRGAGAIASCVLALLLVASPASAATSKHTTTTKPPAKGSVNDQIGSLRSQVEEASAEESELLGKIDDTTAALSDAQAKVAAVDATIADTNQLLLAAQTRLHELNDQLVEAEANVAAANAEVEQARRQLQAQAIEAYVSSTNSTIADLANASAQTNDLAARMGYLASVVDAQERLIHRYHALHVAALDAKAAVAETQSKQQDEADVIVKQKADLEAQRTQQDAVRQKAQDQSDALAQLLTEVESRKAEFESQIAQLQAQSDQIASFLRTAQAGQKGATVGHGFFSMPCPGVPITSGFGPRVHPIFHDVRIHTGIDFGASEGTPILAAADGTVVSAGLLGGYGNATVVDHGNSLATLYGHQSRLLVVAGERVKRGQVIGLVGHTGFATGPHLHFEVRVAGTPVDPMPFL